MSEGPWIHVWHDKFIRGFSGEDVQERLLPQNPVQLIDALRKLHNGDAHFVPYIVVDYEGELQKPSFQRINKPGLPTLRARGFDVQFEVIVFDVDDPAKDGSGKASSAWRKDQFRRYNQLPSELKTGLAWAHTRGGIRYIGCLPRALKPEEYELYHQAFSAALGEYGIQVDPATKDWTRCYRLPRVIRDGVKQDYPMDLKPLDELMAFEPSMKKVRKPKRASARLDHNGVQPIAEGERHSQLMRIGFELRTKKHLSDARLADELRTINADSTRCVAPIPIPELNGIISFVCERQPLSEVFGDQLLAELEAKKPLPRFKSGKLRFTPDSLNRLLHEFPPLVSLVSFDEFSGATFINREVPGQAGRSSRGFPRKIETHDELALGMYLERLSGGSSPRDVLVRQAVEVAARENRFNALQDALEVLPEHDGVPRLDRWLTIYLGAEETEYTQLVGSMFLVQAMARAFEPGCKADYVLILEGRQGARKSNAVLTLAGPFGGDDMPAVDAAKKDHKEYVIGKWIIELAELDALTRKGAQRAAKRFFSQSSDNFRLPYAPRSTEHLRTCVFIGTTNDTHSYLSDSTGNRRYWPVEVHEVDLEALKRDRPQLLAEALAAYSGGAPRWPTDEQQRVLFGPEQAQRLARDPWIEALDRALWEFDETTVSDCLRLLGIKPEHQRPKDQQRIGRALKALGWQKLRTNRDGHRARVYQRPLPNDSGPKVQGV